MTERPTRRPSPRRPKEGGRTASAAPRSRRARAVADLLPDIGRAAFRRFGFVQSSVVSRWPEIAGARYALVSSPESIRFPRGERSGGTLTLVIEGAHAAMMQHVAPVLIERTNRFFGYEAVVRVVIRQGAARVRATARPCARPMPPPPVELGDSLRAIADPELRAVLESVAGGLARAVELPVLGKVR